MTIYKYSLAVRNGRQYLELPEGAKVLGSGFKHGDPSLYIWAMVDPDKPLTARYFRLYWTGSYLGCADESLLSYIDTLQTGDGLVWHLFEEVLS